MCIARIVRTSEQTLSPSICDEGAKLVGFSEVTRNLTERKNAEDRIHQSQSRLAPILDGSTSRIFVKDPEGWYTPVNRKFEDSFRIEAGAGVGEINTDLFPSCVP